MERKFKRQRFRGRFYFEEVCNLARRRGTEAAWLRASERTRNPEAWRRVLHEIRPWNREQPNLCVSMEGRICLIGRVYVRLPDDENCLTKPEVVKSQIDPWKNPLTDTTQWVYLKGNKPARSNQSSFPRRRAPGAPRNKPIPFE